MVEDAPDYTPGFILLQIVGTEVIPAIPGTETAVLKLARLTTTSTSYQTMVSWTVGTGKVGILNFVEMESDNYEKTLFKLTIGGTVMFTDQALEASLSLEFPEVRLAAGTVVTLSAKSTDGTAVNVDGDITGKEIG